VCVCVCVCVFVCECVFYFVFLLSFFVAEVFTPWSRACFLCFPLEALSY
jgi:hypothetical protein